MITVIVKGNHVDVAQGMSAHGISGWKILAYNRRHNECVVAVLDAFESKVQTWFLEDRDRKAPYPVGSMLIYTYHERRTI